MIEHVWLPAYLYVDVDNDKGKKKTKNKTKRQQKQEIVFKKKFTGKLKKKRN